VNYLFVSEEKTELVHELQDELLEERVGAQKLRTEVRLYIKINSKVICDNVCSFLRV
jgi:hypothetical protein